MQQQAALHDIVIGDQLGGLGYEGTAILWADFGDDAPRLRELRIEEHPAREPHSFEHIRERIHGAAYLRNLPADRASNPADRSLEILSYHHRISSNCLDRHEARFLKRALHLQ